MKIAIVTGSHMHELMGGSEYQAWIIATGLVDRSHEVSYLAVNSQQESIELKDRILVYKIPRKNYTGNRNRQRLIKEALSKSIDIVYVRGFYEVASVLPYCRAHKIPLICGISSRMDCMPFLWHPNPIRIFWHLYCFWLLRMASVIVCQTREQVLRLRHYFKHEAFHIIPNGHPLPRKQYSNTNKCPIVLWVNNIKKWKRPEYYVSLAAQLTDVDVDFVMAGKLPTRRYGRAFRNIIEKAPQRFRYVGEIDIEEVNKFLGYSALYVNTSKPEGFPNTFIQAWLRGVPTVSLQFDPDGIIESQGIGRCSKNYEQMVRDVKDLLLNEPLRFEMGRRASRYASEYHNADRMVDEYERLFESICER